MLIYVTLSMTNCNHPTTVNKSLKTEILPPEILYGDLFYKIQANHHLFKDSKTFVDAIPKRQVSLIKEDFSKLRNPSDEELKEFVINNFLLPEEKKSYKADSSDINQHISKLWKVLERPADEKHSGTLIPLPHSYIVPGGRFREVYYWDSYFTILGLQGDGKIEIIQNIVDNFSYLIEEYGFIPNGNRTYYLSRSQPPFYALMLAVLAEEKGNEIFLKYLPHLEKEYNFWMTGKDQLQQSGDTRLRTVKMPDGEILNRYWDNENTPRPESYMEDIETAKKAIQLYPEKTKEEVYRDIRAAAESGWDFSSRWFYNDHNEEAGLPNIHTTNIIPVDLNCLLHNLEKTIAKAYRLKNDTTQEEKFNLLAEKRKAAIKKYFWNEEFGFYFDYNFIENEHTNIWSLAAVFPLFFELSNKEQANFVKEKLEEKFLVPGGLLASTNFTKQQWDAPNGWAPLQYIAIEGLRNYQQDSLATIVKERWLHLNKKVYDREYKILEKYHVININREGGGGEYPNQDGFGWTNGVYKKLSSENIKTTKQP
ncbi:alpha,alpha-trehalase TreA [Mesonia sp.]|uniref:alpha,alpha-trehalase TreA n=1 Tax=Mesonia sp. TaxID=1960830 RepID=UPI00175FC4B4|nr:alpha,alpha-trehalase TreA [Mesonia sp.]HIB36605.1 alpha,alpha-trehalase TreA [Mesonia sp.]HIO27945.1 alpha,alpha-trehalase TreA [Flavobacteriaceae bacterium]